MEKGTVYDNIVPLGKRGWLLGEGNNVNHVISQYPESGADSRGDGKHKLGCAYLVAYLLIFLLTCILTYLLA